MTLNDLPSLSGPEQM